MAWNEPGNSGDKDKDPWGKKRGDDGPPDLEDILKNMQNKVTSLFGGKKRGGGGPRGDSGSGGGMSSIGFVLIFLVAITVWAFFGIYTVTAGSNGVVLQFGKYKDTVGPGLQWYPPFIQTVYIVETDQSRSVRVGLNVDEALMLTRDENIVDVRFEVQYKVKDADNARNFLFSVTNPEDTIKNATESALREVVGKKNMKSVLEREDVAEKTGELLQTILDRYNTGILIQNVNLDYSDAPEQVKPAFNDVNSAEQDRDRYIEEAKKYQNQILPIARGEAARIKQEAEAYMEEKIAKAKGDVQRFKQLLVEYQKAPKVTRERLYLETMEEVLSKNNKVMIDVKKGNNVMYLPIDQMNKRQLPSEQNNQGTTQSLPEKVNAIPSSRDRSRSRTRGER